MNKRNFTGLVVFMAISIIGIIALQLIWMNNAIQVKNELFSRSVNDALNSTAKKLEDRQNLNVVNRMVFNDSLEWESGNKKYDFYFETMPAPPPLPDTFKTPPRPVQIIRKQAPKSSHKNVEVRVEKQITDSNNKIRFLSDSSKKNSKNGFIFNFENPGSPDSIILVRDTLILNADSFFSVSMVKIDSLLSRIDSDVIIAPELSTRVKKRAGNLKQVASQVFTEIVTWDEINLDTSAIVHLLKNELQNRNIPIRFDFGILNDNELRVFSGDADSVQLTTSEYQVDLYPNAIFNRNLKLAVVFPGREGFIYRSLNWLLVASFLFSFFILAAFAGSIYYILRQKKISEIKSDFINNMTHEFKTPIATISVAADSINNEKVISDAEKVRYFTGMIKKENARMNRQVEDILTIARLDKKEFEFKWENIDVHDLLKDAIQSINLQVEKREGKITTKFEASNPLVTTDKTHCTNVFYNLLDNAIKYSARPPEVTISTQNKPKGVLISVEDKGIGMTKNVQSKIFEKFYRQESGNVHNVKGFGLGLSYAKAVIEASKGTISVQSELGKGSRFDVFLPFVRE
jgi:two-component system, OmpR family, phosphate regulon sensor histidine kinase PhoR